MLQEKQNSTNTHMTPIRFIEDTGSYAHRTRANAQWADLTVAIAVDLNTSGEQLTLHGDRDIKEVLIDNMNRQYVFVFLSSE